MQLNNGTWHRTGAFTSLFLLSRDLWFWDGGIHLGPGNFLAGRKVGTLVLFFTVVATGVIPKSFVFGFLPVIPIVLVSSAIIVAGSLPGAGLSTRQT